MITVAEYPQLRLYWYDDERTIFVGEVNKAAINPNVQNRLADYVRGLIVTWALH